MDIIVNVYDHNSGPPILELIKVLGGLIVFALGLWQYRCSQKWKRVEFVAAEMDKFFSAESVKAALLMLDWSQKTIHLYKYRGDDLTTEWVTYELVSTSLGTDPTKHYSVACVAIREIFDHFLTYLERFESFIEAGVLEENDLIPYLHYWTKLLSGSDRNSPVVTNVVLPQLWQYVGHYRYNNVFRLISRYDAISPELLETYNGHQAARSLNNRTT